MLVPVAPARSRTAIDIDLALEQTCAYWEDWAARYNQDGKYAAIVERSLLVLRALTHEDTGGIVAAPTTSLPEDFGGARNWDYRFCWLRDAALTLEAMLTHGYADEALKWRDWLLRAVAGDPEDLQIMYGLSGERDLAEGELGHLPGYEGAAASPDWQRCRGPVPGGRCGRGAGGAGEAAAGGRARGPLLLAAAAGHAGLY